MTAEANFAGEHCLFGTAHEAARASQITVISVDNSHNQQKLI
jgi:hypothetical protein